MFDAFKLVQELQWDLRRAQHRFQAFPGKGDSDFLISIYVGEIVSWTGQGLWERGWAMRSVSLTIFELYAQLSHLDSASTRQQLIKQSELRPRPRPLQFK